MAEDAPGGGDSPGELLTRKVGPLPLWAWAGVFVVVWYVVSRKKAAATGTATNSTGTTGTDPAGNTGNINPLTGYVYGSPEDIAALQQQNAALNGSSSSGSSSGSSTTYSSNQQWEQAAINYLVGLGDDTVVANGAISAYLQSQTLTPTQQAMVNSAVLALGAPPDPPAPSTTTTIVSPPGGATTYADNPPTGLATAAVSASSVTLKWNAAKNATGYTVTVTPTGSSNGKAQTVTSTTPMATIGGLAAQTSYKVTVQGTPADAGASAATTTFTTPYGVVGPPGSGNPVTPTGQKTLTPGQQISVPYVIKPPDTLSKAASKYGIAPQHLINFNPGSTLSTTGEINVPYKVNPGDTVSSIAGKFYISPEHLEQVLAAEGVI